MKVLPAVDHLSNISIQMGSETDKGLSSWGNICRVAAPALLLNVAPPLALSVETALIGHQGQEMLAAFAATNTTFNTAASLFNYLSDGISARVGRLVGGQQHAAARLQVSFVLGSAAGAGCAAAAALAALRSPVCALLQLQPAVRQAIGLYWTQRCLMLPITMLNMGVSGLLQGHKLVALSAALTSSQAVLDAVGSCIVFLLLSSRLPASLPSLGWVTLGTSLAALVAGSGLVWCECVQGTEHQTTSEDESVAAIQPLLEQSGCLQEPVQGESPGFEAGMAGEGQLAGFLSDGANMIIRSTLLQATFFMAIAAASRISTAALAAHQVVAQLWMVTSYTVDAFAAAGTVLGSRLVARPASSQEAKREFMQLRRRTLLAGLTVGVSFSALFLSQKQHIISLFVGQSDTEVVHILQGPVWLVVCLAQVLNSSVFVYDGLLLAVQAFAWTRTVMLAGFVLIFCPLLAAAHTHHSLWGIWGAKFGLNIVRLAGAIWRVNFHR